LIAIKLHEKVIIDNGSNNLLLERDA